MEVLVSEPMYRTATYPKGVKWGIWHRRSRILGNFYHFRAKQVGRASIATVSLRVGVTGGGSAGHVVPALAVAAEFRRRGQDDLVFFGRADSIEERLATQAGLSFVALPAAGLRRYRSWKNLTLPFVVLWGVARAIITVRRSRISVLLCKGGYVSVPAAIGAWANRVPFAIHESDHSLGLANRILARFATKVLTSSPSTQVSVRGRKITGICTGLPVRPDLETADPGRFRVKHGLPPEGRVLLVFCGSSGSVRINDAVRSELDALLKDFLVVHVCGPSNVDEQLNGTPGYFQFEYLNEDMADALWLADVVIGRAGATTLAELDALGKPAVLIPLPLSVSRGDQIVNADTFAASHPCVVLPDDSHLADGLVAACVQLIPAADAAGRGVAEGRDVHRAARAVAQEVAGMARSRHRRPAARPAR
jgi:UDP-N-acetylglucosamine--N-acetylmuramyl-(pentapeptide) pyrophosphoryl-undecaprenol N-acetylglucosamine transferase